MSDAASNTSESVRLLAEQHGLAKALKLYPDGVKAAAERGVKPLGDLPKGTTSISSPAHIFNPARFERGE
jgi:dihydroorotase